MDSAHQAAIFPFLLVSGSSRLSYKPEGVAHIVISESFSLFSLSPVVCEFSV